MDIKIIYEDKNILVINKPVGLVVHGADESVVSWLIKKYPGIKNVGEDKSRPGIVHRLDKDTSGVLLIAKNQKTFDYLKQQFQERKIKKKYIALVHGIVKNDKGLIELPIAKSKKDFRKKATIGKLRGKTREAITKYKVLRKFVRLVRLPMSNIYTLVEVEPETGRTHQIRVHFKAIGHPVVCDKLYGFKKALCPFDLSRHFLHASSLELNLPSSARIKLEADLPEDLQATLTKIEKGV